jgi:hypothetical protein
LLGEAIATPASAVGRPGSTESPANSPAGYTTISSPAQQNVSYQFRSFWDFLPADTFGAGRQWGGSGMYTPGSLDPLIVTFDAPAGAVLHDIEWYVANTVGTSWGVGLWGAGHGIITGVMGGTLAAGTR